MTLSSSRISKEYYLCHTLWHCMNQRNKHPTLQFLLLSLPWRCMNQRNKAANPTITSSVALWHCMNQRNKHPTLQFLLLSCTMTLHKSQKEGATKANCRGSGWQNKPKNNFLTMRLKSSWTPFSVCISSPSPFGRGLVGLDIMRCRWWDIIISWQ